MDSASPAPRVNRSLVLLTVIVGTFLGRLDQTIVNLALPKIIDDFHITVSSAGWIATAYILANAVFVPIWGKLGDSIGRKKVYVLGFMVFIVGSMLAGFAWDLGSMIVFRVIQAIASSADYPTAMAILAVTYQDAKERGRALGIWSSSFAASAVLGPLVGGPLIDHLSWRAVFLINLPVGLIGLIMAMAYIQESTAPRGAGKPFDVWGALVLGIALSALVLVLDRGLDWGWLSARSLLAYAVIAATSAAFFWIERRHPDPVVDLRFFRIPTFNHTLINNFIVFMGMMGSIFLVPIFAQTFLGYDATETGYLFIPMAAALMLGAPIGARLTGLVQSRIIIAVSTLVAAAGLWLFTGLDPRSSAWDAVLPLSVLAFGLGFGMAERTNIIAAAVPPAEIGVASSILALIRNISGAFGIAIFGTLLNSSIERHVLSINAQSDFHGTAEQYTQYVGLISLKAQISGYHDVFFASALLLLAGTILVLFMGRTRLTGKVQVHAE